MEIVHLVSYVSGEGAQLTVHKESVVEEEIKQSQLVHNHDAEVYAPIASCLWLYSYINKKRM